jgi:hypothetical protein
MKEGLASGAPVSRPFVRLLLSRPDDSLTMAFSIPSVCAQMASTKDTLTLHVQKRMQTAQRS